MLKNINHIGIAVKSIQSALKLYRDTLKLEFSGIEEVASAKVKVAFLKIGKTNIELLEALTSESPIAKFIETEGEGIHHIAFETDDIEKALSEIAQAGYTLIDTKPREGAHNTKVAFAHPKSTGGVLIELVQKI
ncbi:MAG: methylmalonyl-CoA epimerase [Elusimicrobiota bacterium]